jgi:ribosomal-protein-alanine N-acetyltransferase
MDARPIETFRTRRLVAERLEPRHLEALCSMHRDARVMATLGGVRADDETHRFLLTNIDHWHRHGFGLWVFRDRRDGGFVGRGGLRHVVIEGTEEVELAYALLADRWGRGLATEMARAILEFAFARLARADVVCLTLPGNLASRRVMEKAGFRFEREASYAARPHVLYRIDTSTWMESGGAQAGSCMPE